MARKTQREKRKRKYFTVDEANASLPLVRSILRDLTSLVRDLRERHDRISQIRPPQKGSLGSAHEEEMRQAKEDFERDQEKIKEYEGELTALGIEIKDYQTGLIDFPCWMNGHEVLLCWRLGEPEVEHWHEVNAGFAGRKKIVKDAVAH